jgi:acetyl-CoA carboxylase carboxyltransferase component
MKTLVSLCVDGGDFFEIAPDFGESLIVALARVDGHPIGIIANNAAKHGGALDQRAADKQGRFLDFCDVFHIPVAYFVDIPGFMIGQQAERAGTLRSGMRAIWIWQNITIPTFTVQVRKCYGMAGAATSDASRLSYRVAWPSGEFGSIPIEGGVSAAFRKDIEASADPQARMEELEAELQVLRNVFRTAEAGGVEEIIDPVETRQYLQRFVEMAYRTLEQDRGKKSRVGFRP